MVLLVFKQIHDWEERLENADRPLCLRAMRIKTNTLELDAAGRLVETNGWAAMAWIMREYTRGSGFQARCDTALAGDLVEHGLSDTVAAMSAGEITAGHARVIAKAAPRPHRKGEAELLALARDYAVDTCGRFTLAYESIEQMADAAASAAAGPTDIPNLATLCPSCHDLVHDHNWNVTTPADGHPKLRAPEHLRLPPNPAPANPPALVNPVLRT